MKSKRTLLLVAAVSVATSAMWPASPSKAEVIPYTFQSFDDSLTLTGTLTTDANGQVINMTGTFSGLVADTINGVITNSSFPNAMNTSSQGGYYITYDNLFEAGGSPLLTNAGIAFTTTNTITNNPPDIWNLFSDSPSTYELVDLSGNGLVIDVLGIFSVPGPQPGQGTFALAALAALLAFARSRKVQSNSDLGE